MFQGVFDGGLEVSKLATAVVALADKSVGEYALFRQQLGNGVGKLYFTPSAAFCLLKELENSRGKDVTPDHGEVGWSGGRLGLLDDLFHLR